LGVDLMSSQERKLPSVAPPPELSSSCSSANLTAEADLDWRAIIAP